MNTLCNYLNMFLDLPYQPVGVRFLYSEQDYQESNFLEVNAPLPYCKAVKKAASGKPCKFSLAHMACLAGARAVGLLKPKDDICPENDIISGKRLENMGLHADLCIARQMASNMVYCAHTVYGVEVATLGFCHRQPHVVIIVCTPQAAMRIIQGYAYHFGQVKAVNIGGNQALCQECTSYVFESNQLNVSMLCAGTRRVAQWKPEEMAVGLPYSSLTQILHGIQQTADPVESRVGKALIQAKAKKYDLDVGVDLVEGKNYFTGGYGTVDFHKKRMAHGASKPPFNGAKK